LCYYPFLSSRAATILWGRLPTCGRLPIGLWLQPAFSRLLSPAPVGFCRKERSSRGPSVTRSLPPEPPIPTGVKTQRTMLISTARIQAWLAAPFLLILLDAGCSRTPRLTEYDQKSNSQARSAPLVVVGLADSDLPIGRPLPSRHDPNYPMQLHRVKVRIENILKGSAGEPTIFVYYFAFAGGFDGPRPVGFGREPSRRILWLRRDGGSLRMACDGWDGCTMFVKSGAHPQYRADPQQPLNRALADILLTRGEGEINDL